MRYLAVSVALALVACGSSDDGSRTLISAGGGYSGASGSGGGLAPVCAAGQQIACACPGGLQGAQACNATGTGYGACACPTGMGGSAGTTTGKGGASGSGTGGTTAGSSGKGGTSAGNAGVSGSTATGGASGQGGGATAGQGGMAGTAGASAGMSGAGGSSSGQGGVAGGSGMSGAAGAGGACSALTCTVLEIIPSSTANIAVIGDINICNPADLSGSTTECKAQIDLSTAAMAYTNSAVGKVKATGTIMVRMESVPASYKMLFIPLSAHVALGAGVDCADMSTAKFQPANVEIHFSAPAGPPWPAIGCAQADSATVTFGDWTQCNNMPGGSTNVTGAAASVLSAAVQNAINATHCGQQP